MVPTKNEHAYQFFKPNPPQKPACGGNPFPQMGIQGIIVKCLLGFRPAPPIKECG